MNTVLQGLMPKTCLVNLDNVIVHGKSADGHMKNIREVFLRLREAGLKLNPKKCNKMQSSVKYLGHIVSSECVKIDPENTPLPNTSWICRDDKGGISSSQPQPRPSDSRVRHSGSIAVPAEGH